jgi:acyl-CoA oxidase
MAYPQIHTVEDLSPEARSFLPLLHLAWADDVLTPTEVRMIQTLIDQQDWINDTDKAWLEARLDPAQPPQPREIKAWEHIIHQHAREMPQADQRDLVAFSLRLARLGAKDHPGQFKSESVRRTLTQLGQSLGVDSQEALRRLLAPVSRDHDSLDGTPPKPSFDVAALQQRLDEPHSELRQQVKLLLSDPFFAYDKIPSDKESYRELVLTWMEELARRGYGGLSFPKEHGGANDMGQYMAVFETIGHHDLSLLIKYGVQYGLFGGSIFGLGTAYHHQTYLPGIIDLSLPGGFAMTEANHGSNVRDLETTATYDAVTQSFTLHTPRHDAHKEYIGNVAAHAKWVTVFAQLETQGEHYGVHAFVVPIRDEQGQPMPGVTIGDSGRKLGLNGVDNGRLWFDQVSIPRENLLDRFAQVDPDGTYHSEIASEGKRFFTMLSTLVAGRVAVPIGGLSAAKSGLTIALKYAYRRRQFGRSGEPEMPIIGYPTHQQRLMPRLAKLYALHFAHRWLVQTFLHDQDAEMRELEALAAGLKAVSTWHTTHTLQESREATGGKGYLWVNRLADLKADSDIFTTFEGDNMVLLQLVAKGRLSQFKAEFGSMNFLGLARYLAGEVIDTITEKNPLSIRKTDPEHLRDAEVQLGLFRHREEQLVRTAAQRMKHRLDQGMDSYDAFLEVQAHLVTMAKAYIERVILEQMIKAEQESTDQAQRKVLGLLRSLYALDEIYQDRAWFLESGYLEGSKAKAIRKEVATLCEALVPEGYGLVEAFGIPQALLGAPIAEG